MSILTTDLRKQNLINIQYRPGVRYYSMDTKTTKMKDSLNEELFLNTLHQFPDILKKNLADTLSHQKSDLNSPELPKERQNENSKLSGITNFISGVFNVVSSVVFKRKPEFQESDSWQYSKTEYFSDVSELNKIYAMPDCKTAAASCEAKLDNIRRLLPPKTQENLRARPRRPKKEFINSSSVEERFQDAISFEDCISLPETQLIKYYIPLKYQGYEFKEIQAPEYKIEGHSEETQTKNLPAAKEIQSVETETVVLSCEDKMMKLKEFLNRNKSKMSLDVDGKDQIKSKHSKTTSKKHKNPNHTSKREKTNMKLLIEDDMSFAEEYTEDSPEEIQESSSLPQTNFEEYFNEISGRFRTASTSSEDSFQIVFSDRKRYSSECDSEDSFIIFEDTEDCYTSNDVFNDSDSDYSDSGCNMKLSQSLTRTFSNLTDDNLYDEVDNVKPIQKLKEPIKRTPELDTVQDETSKLLAKKQVRFSPLPPKVHVMRVWAFAARQARAGPWERYALDRERFKRRIADVDMALSWVLKPQHRSRIMFQRFMPWWNAQKRKELAEKKEMAEKMERDKAEEERRVAQELQTNEKIVEVKEDVEKDEYTKHEELKKLGDDNEKDELGAVNYRVQSKEEIQNDCNLVSANTEDGDKVKKEISEKTVVLHEGIAKNENLKRMVLNKLANNDEKGELMDISRQYLQEEHKNGCYLLFDNKVHVGIDTNKETNGKIVAEAQHFEKDRTKHKELEKLACNNKNGEFAKENVRKKGKECSVTPTEKEDLCDKSIEEYYDFENKNETDRYAKYNDNFHTKLENNVLEQHDRKVHSGSLVRNADTRLLESNGEVDAKEISVKNCKGLVTELDHNNCTILEVSKCNSDVFNNSVLDTTVNVSGISKTENDCVDIDTKLDA